MSNLQDRIDTSNDAPGDIMQWLHGTGKLEDILRQGELIYLLFADVCRPTAEWSQYTLFGAASRIGSHGGENCKEALEYTRKELELDVACAGHKLPCEPLTEF